MTISKVNICDAFPLKKKINYIKQIENSSNIQLKGIRHKKKKDH
jgi:hypothetical protein